MFFVLVVLQVASNCAIIMNSGHEAVFVSPLRTKYIRNVLREREREMKNIRCRRKNQVSKV